MIFAIALVALKFRNVALVAKTLVVRIYQPRWFSYRFNVAE
jgi:hypothetical protein